MAIEKTINLNVDSRGAVNGLNNLEKSIDGVNKEVKDVNQSTQQMGGVLDKATGGAVSKFKAFKGSIGGVTKGFKSLRVAIIGTGIGALLIAVTSLGQAFTRSEEGQNKFAKILGVIGSVTGNLLDLLADLGENIISVFENPKQAFKSFQEALKENITNRITSLIETFGFLGKAVKKVFSGDFKGALDSAKNAGSSFVDSFTGVKGSIDKAADSIKNFSKEISNDANAAAKIADQRANAEKLARDLIVESAAAERDIAALREKAVNKDKFSAEERIKFLEEAGAISDALAEKETKAAKLKLAAKLSENALTKSTKADLEEAAQLEANVIQLETKRLNLQKRLSTELLTARREEAAANQAIVDAENKRNEEAAAKEGKRLDDIGKIQEEYKQKQLDKDAETELQKIELEEQRKLAELERLNASELQKQEVRDYYSGLRVENQKELDAKEKAETEQAAAEDIALNKKVKDAKVGMAQQTLGLIGAIAGKGSKIAKGVAIAQATISGIQATQNAYTTAALSPITTVFPAYPFVQAGLAAGFAALNIASIKSTSSSGGGGVSAPSGGGGAAAPKPPSFNIVGASDTNQLADAVAGQEKQPTQAYVVANDVTSAQSLQNNIVEGSTID